MTSVKPVKYYCTPKSQDIIRIFPRNLKTATRSSFCTNALLLLLKGTPLFLFFLNKVCVNDLRGKKEKKQQTEQNVAMFCFLFSL